MRPTPPGFPPTQLDLSSTSFDDGQDTLEPIDDGLHYSRSWHRYRYCYRRAGHIRVLDAGCGTGRSTLCAATLNPDSNVLGVDLSEASIEMASERAEAAGFVDVRFTVHDLTEPLPSSWGLFDFIICRDVLGQTADPDRILAVLARSLDPSGLLLATFPSYSSRQPARALRQAVDALANPDSSLEERFQIGLDLFQSLRHDHPIRLQTGAAPDPARVVEEALIGRRDWTLEDATNTLRRAGLRFLYAATPWRWRSDRVFAPDAADSLVVTQLDRLNPEQLTKLVDALDPTMLDDQYRAYACLEDYSPQAPSWPRTRQSDPESFDALIPHLTGLAKPTRLLPSAAPGRVIYKTVSGGFVEIDRLASLMLDSVDGVTPCGAIDETLAARTRASDNVQARQECWVYLADTGLVILESRPS